MNGDLVNQVAKNTNEISKLYNQRKAVVARQYGEEHDAVAQDGLSVFYLCHDVDTEYIAEYKFKLIITGSGVSQAGGTYINFARGYNTYPTYNSWITDYPVGSAVDCDGYYGAQCWDYACAFWYSQCNRMLQTGNGAARGCWELMRTVNAGTEFDLITDPTQLKQGDWIVMAGGTYGHICMAAQDYSGTNYIQCYGQNQGGTPMPRGGAAVNIVSLGLGNFLGAFRYKGWHS
jgi:hypothetical protein